MTDFQVLILVYNCVLLPQNNHAMVVNLVFVSCR